MTHPPAPPAEGADWASHSRAVLRGITRAIGQADSGNALLEALTGIVGHALRVDRALIYDVQLDAGWVRGHAEWLNPEAPGVTPTLATYPLAAFGAGAAQMWASRAPLESHADAPSPPLVTDGSAAVLHEVMAIRSLLWHPFNFRSDGYHLLVLNQVTHRRRWDPREYELITDVADQVGLAVAMLAVRERDLAVTEAAARQARRIQTIITHHPAAVLFETPDRRVQLTNAHFCRMFGIPAPPEALIGADCAAAAVASSALFVDPAGFLARTEAIVRDGLPVHAERLALRDGRVFERDYATIDDGGTETGHLWLYRDVTRQVADDGRLRQLERAIEQVPVGVVISDVRGAVQYVNEKFLDVFRTQREVACGLSAVDLLGPFGPDDEFEVMHDLLAVGGSWKGEVTLRRADGTPLPAHLSVSPIFDEHRQIGHYVGLVQDLTDARRAAEALRAADERLRLAQKMETASRFASGVAHDFNNLLAIIQSYTSLVLDDLHVDDPVARDLLQVRLAAERAATLTRRLLAFGRQDPLEPRAVPVNGAVLDLERVLRRLVGEAIEVVVELDDHAGDVWVDPSQLEQALLNLVINARDAMPDGGALTLATSRGDAARPPELPDGRYTRITVGDTGTGMDPETTSRVFEPFFTTKAPGRGTGLGLPLVYAFVRQSHGAVTVASQLGRGTTFTLWLPTVADVRSHVTPAPAVPRAPTDGRESVLVIEDEAEIRSLIRRILSRLGYRVAVAANAGEALLWCERHGDDVQLLLCDVIMPGMHGPELIERVRPLCPRARVLFMSGYVDTQSDRIPPGARMLHKPFDLPTLQRMVRGALDSPE